MVEEPARPLGARSGSDRGIGPPKNDTERT